MAEQEERIRNFFYEWKGDNDQVDDVLMMGLKGLITRLRR